MQDLNNSISKKDSNMSLNRQGSNANYMNNDEDNEKINSPNNMDLSQQGMISPPKKNPLKDPKQQQQRFNVIARIRPQIENDKLELTTNEELKPCVSKKNSNTIILKNEKTDNNYEYIFDHVLDEKDDQDTLYGLFVDQLLNDIFRGYNGTIMVYGQTGSGKSYTMFGKTLGEREEKQNWKTYVANGGLVQRAICEIFRYRDQNKGKKGITISVSFMQIYLGQITDLLNKNSDVVFSVNDPEKPPEFRFAKEEGKNLRIKNSLKTGYDKDGKIYVKGLKEEEVTELDQLFIAIEKGIASRVTSTTIVNQTSSRSHAILKIIVKQRWIERIKNNTTQEVIERLYNLKGTLTFVDLAGSECVSRTGSENINLDEAKEINKSISALGRVIEALSRKSQYLNMKGINEVGNENNKEMGGSKIYVSYRDSKLTEILSECLGGNSKTYIIANVSPAMGNCEETFSTLQFANRAITIRTQARKNERIDLKKFNKSGKETTTTIVNNLGTSGKKKSGNSKFMGESMGKNKNSGSSMFSKLYNKSEKNFSNNDKEREKYLEGKKEDYISITKKFYSMILYLQEELGKLTVQNYALEQENNFLKEQLKNLY